MRTPSQYAPSAAPLKSCPETTIMPTAEVRISAAGRAALTDNSTYSKPSGRFLVGDCRAHSADALTHGNRKIHAGMDGIAKEIASVHVVDINAISVEPFHRPWVNHGEPKTTVLKAPRRAREIGAVYVKRVAAAKTSAEAIVWNAPMTCPRLRSVGLLLRWSRLLLCGRLLLRRFRLLLCTRLLLSGFRLLLCARLLLRWLRLLLLLLWLLFLFGRARPGGGSDGSGKEQQTGYS